MHSPRVWSATLDRSSPHRSPRASPRTTLRAMSPVWTNTLPHASLDGSARMPIGLPAPRLTTYRAVGSGEVPVLPAQVSATTLRVERQSSGIVPHQVAQQCGTALPQVERQSSAIAVKVDQQSSAATPLQAERQLGVAAAELPCYAPATNG